jgi:hypothetical protein
MIAFEGRVIKESQKIKVYKVEYIFATLKHLLATKPELAF